VKEIVMSRDSEGHAGVILMAFVLGAITGAAVALLSTPASGSDTRRYLGDKARESREKAEVAARQGREFVDRQREHLSTAIDRGREAYQRAREGQPAEDQG
jgi:gas vesicle protein